MKYYFLVTSIILISSNPPPSFLFFLGILSACMYGLYKYIEDLESGTEKK